MCNLIFFLFGSFRSLVQSRLRPQAEVIALQHQITVLRRSQRGRVRLCASDPVFWVWLSRLRSGWRSALAIVKPETVISWHRKGFRLYWAWKSGRGTPGRPEVSEEVRDLVRKMSKANPLWGSAAYPWGTAQNRYRSVPSDGGEVHGSPMQAALPDLAYFS